MAVYIREANLAQPSQLSFHVQQLIRSIFGLQCVPDAMQELLMQFGRNRGYMLEITENASGVHPGKNLGVKRPLAFMNEMVNSEARNHGIEEAELGKRILEIVANDGNGAIIGEALASSPQHGRREIDGHRHCSGAIQFDQGKQPSIACAEIKNTARGRWNELQKSRFALHPVRDGICPLQVSQRMFGRGPQIDAHTESIN